MDTKRRKRVAKRMVKRFPLFAVEFMKDEFSDYNHETFIADIKKVRIVKKKKGRSPLKRQGRYTLMQAALTRYYLTKDLKYLYEAQKIRNKMFLHFEVEFRLGREKMIYCFASTTSVKFIQGLAGIKFNSWEELKTILDEKLKYSHLG